MGWFKDLFKKKERVSINWFDWLNGRAPIYNQYGEGIYVNEVVQDCIYRIVCEVKKLRPKHVRVNEDEDIIPIEDSRFTRALRSPNPLMTKADFLEKITFNLLLNYNSFIYPVENPEGVLELYPLQPKKVEWLENKDGAMWIGMSFENDYYIELPYDRLIHLRYKYSVGDLMGGNREGEPDTKALKKVLQMNDMLLDGLLKQLKVNMNINAIAKMKTMHNSDAQLNLIKEFEKKLMNNESGILPVDISTELDLIQNKIQFLDSDTLRFIDEKIYRPFGVSSPIMKVDYSTEQHAAFYQTAIEPLVVTYEDAFTKGLFTIREIGHGNQIKFFTKPLMFCSMQQTLEAIRIMGDSGTMFENEKRIAIGLIPSKELVGKRMYSKNYGDAKHMNDEVGGAE